MKLKIFKIIFLCLIIATVVVGALVAMQYIGMFNNNREVKNAMTSITKQFEDVNNANTRSTGVIDAEYKGNKVVRNNRNTCN